MKILRLLNSKYFSIVIIFLFFPMYSNADDEPIDIWSLDREKLEDTSPNNILNNKIEDNTKIPETNIYKTQSQKKLTQLNLIKILILKI